MTAILTKVQQFLDSDDIDGARVEIAKNSINLTAVNDTVRDFAVLLALGSQKVLEITLGVLGSELLNNKTDVNTDVVWLLLAAVLSRQNITSDSLSRISILGLTSCVENWESPIFALLTPALDSFFSAKNPLITEQTLDFITIFGNTYAKAPHSRTQLRKLKSLAKLVLEQVDDLELKEEWTEGWDQFFQKADQSKYDDANICSAGSNLLKKIYTPQILKRDRGLDDAQVKDNIVRLITSSLAAIGTILDGDGLSVAVRIDNREKNNWSVDASAIDKLQQLFQEVAKENKIFSLPSFTPTQAIPGSWTIILHINLKSEQSNLLAKAISSLPSTEYGENESNSSMVDSWRECVAKLKESNLRVNLAVSTNTPELHVVRAISTEDSPNVEEFFQPKIRVLSHDVPQADSLERVVDFASLLIQYPSSPETVRQKFLEIDEMADRQYYYYQRGLKILGLADERGRPTNACFTLNRLSTEEKIRFLSYQFISSNVGLAWFNWQNASDLSEIESAKAVDFLIAVCPSLSEITVKRRAQTLQSWLRSFRGYEEKKEN